MAKSKAKAVDGKKAAKATAKKKTVKATAPAAGAVAPVILSDPWNGVVKLDGLTVTNDRTGYAEQFESATEAQAAFDNQVEGVQ